MFKHYITHKRGETNADIQDSIDYDLSKGKYAISDGVTQSFIPQIWSKVLVNHYVSTSENKLTITDDLLKQFDTAKEQFIHDLDDDQRFFQELAEDEFKNAAATFAGIKIENHNILWQVIGDSCIFIVSSSGVIRCVNSMPDDIDSKGHINMSFDNHPDYIISNGTIKGSFIEGCCSLDSGWIVMMTDALSSWFITQFNAGNDPLDILMTLNDIDDFEGFIEKEYRDGRLKSDDSTVLIISIDSEYKGTNTKDDYLDNDWIWEILPLWTI